MFSIDLFLNVPFLLLLLYLLAWLLNVVMIYVFLYNFITRSQVKCPVCLRFGTFYSKSFESHTHSALFRHIHVVLNTTEIIFETPGIFGWW